MKIRIHKKGNRNQLICTRNNGTTERSDLGPALPFHDIAHFVVESQLKLQGGFYGNIAKGYSVAQLSDKEIIKTLPQESLVAEILTRALQSLTSGAVTSEQFGDMVQEEFRKWNIRFETPNERIVASMRMEYESYLHQWNDVNDGDYLEFDWRN